MYEHLRTWTFDSGYLAARIDLWDTGRTRDGKSELRYALHVLEGKASDLDSRSAIYEGEDFWPSPLHAIDSDATAAALLSFFVADGESIRWAPDSDYADERARGYTEKQRELLSAQYETLSLWASELEGAE
jgi:hypothetical protein